LKVGIFDYGAGNLFNIALALERQGLEATILKEIPRDDEFDGLVLPGVGNFRLAFSRINQYRSVIVDRVRRGNLLLGICLGMQLFFESSEEGQGEGLGLIRGKVVCLPDSVKIPHMGWNQLEVKKASDILDGITNGSWCYFVHSYYASTSEPVTAAVTEYEVTFPSVIESGALVGTQFHPEKSGRVGRTILHNFARMLRR